MFPLSNFVYLYVCVIVLKFVYSMSIESTDDCGPDPYETGCLVESFPGLNKETPQDRLVPQTEILFC